MAAIAKPQDVTSGKYRHTFLFTKYILYFYKNFYKLMSCNSIFIGVYKGASDNPIIGICTGITWDGLILKYYDANTGAKFEDEIFTCCSASFSTSIKGLSCNESLIGIFSDVDGNPLFAKFEGIKGGIAILIYYNATGEIYLGTVYYCCSSGGGGAVTDGDYGDITVSSGGTNWTINSLAVTNSMINDMDASKLNTDVNHRVVTDAQIATWNALIGGSVFQTTWNATTNSPTLASGVGTKGYYYIVATAGSTNLDGITDWKIGDWAIFDGTVWRKVDNTDAVSSVNGLTGAVSLDSSNVPDTLNKRYVTDADLVEIATIPDKLNQVQTLKLISIGF